MALDRAGRVGGPQPIPESMDESVCLLCSDSDGELGFALGRASQRAAQAGRVLWVYAYQGFLWLSDRTPEEGKTPVAKCYPGGRIERRRR